MNTRPPERGICLERVRALPDYPNILYVHSHDTGRWVEPYGYPVQTPNIQKLAEEGVMFRKAFCAAPTCSGSRACLLTGQYAHSNGMVGLAHRGFPLKDYRHHIVHTLRKLGYWSGLIGEQHISKKPEVIGYDEVIKIDTSHVDDVAPVAVELLTKRLRQPFFLSVGFFETHREFFQPSSPKKANYVLPPPNLPDTPEIRQDMAAYHASAHSLDVGIERVLDALDASGIADNTLVICTTDHGLAFPGAKATLFDRGLGVMLILRGPDGFFTGGKASDALVSHIDLFPTICDIVGVERPEYLQGESLLPLVNGEADEVREAIFAEKTYHVAYEPERCVRTHRWKYIRRFGDREKLVLANVDDGPTKDLLLASGWGERRIPEEQLYDLVFNPNETRNLADDPAAADVLEEMRERLDDWMRETRDPLLDGPVPAPPGAELNTSDQLSPNDPTTFV